MVASLRATFLPLSATRAAPVGASGDEDSGFGVVSGGGGVVTDGGSGAGPPAFDPLADEAGGGAT